MSPWSSLYIISTNFNIMTALYILMCWLNFFFFGGSQEKKKRVILSDLERWFYDDMTLVKKGRALLELCLIFSIRVVWTFYTFPSWYVTIHKYVLFRQKIMVFSYFYIFINLFFLNSFYDCRRCFSLEFGLKLKNWVRPFFIIVWQLL